MRPSWALGVRSDGTGVVLPNSDVDQMKGLEASTTELLGPRTGSMVLMMCGVDLFPIMRMLSLVTYINICN